MLPEKYHIALKTSLVYLIFAFLWLFVGSFLLAKAEVIFALSEASIAFWELTKGILFVLISSIILGFFIYQYNTSQEEHLHLIVELNKELKNSLKLINQQNEELQERYADLASQHKFYTTIAHNLPNTGILTVSKQLKVTFADGETVQEIGGKEAIEHKTVFELNPPEAAKILEQHYRKAFAGEGQNFDIKIAANYYQVSVALLPNREEVLVCFKNITGNKREEARRRDMLRRLKDKNQRLHHYSFSLSHELRRPLANILGLANLLKEEYSPEILENLQLSAKQLDEVLHELARRLD